MAAVKKIGQYVLGDTLGTGSFGVVRSKLCCCGGGMCIDVMLLY